MPGSTAAETGSAAGSPPVPRRRWLAALRRVHVVHRRVRWVYQLAEGVAHSATALHEAVLQLPGVVDARVNPVLRSLVLSFDHTQTTLEHLESRVLDLVAPLHQGTVPPAAAHASRQAWLPVALGLANLLVNRWLPRQAQLVSTAAVAWPVWRQGAGDLLRLHLGSHLLEATAVLVSLRQRDLTAANTTVFLLLLGEYLEESISSRSDALLLSLLRPSDGDVWVQRDGVDVQVPQSELQIGEAVVLTSGSIAPVDGTVLDGRATMNEAAMTGEGRPCVKTRGDRVLSGTVVEEGRLVLYAEQVGGETAAARIASTVRDSLASRSTLHIQASRLADRLVPGVFTLAGLTLLFSRSWRRTAAVLQADYCCALKLAIPVAFKAAMARAGSRGILVKGASALEQLAQADTVLFDKTGTLTTGRLQVCDTLSFDGTHTANDILNLAASIEEHAVHPVAMAVVQAARDHGYRHFEHSEVEFVVAHGVVSRIGNQRVVVGSRHFVVEDEGLDASPYEAAIEPLIAAGKSLLYIGFAGQLIGVVALQDQLRPNSAETVRRLRALGIRQVLMLSGDRQDLAETIAAACGLDGAYGELLPDDKARIVADLTAQGSSVVFVGDGINDAPALTGASVGIAMQKGAEIARLSADISLLDDDIARVADVKQMANDTMGRIDWNSKAAVAINTGILGAASLGMLSPVHASVLHNGSTLGILVSALAASSQQPGVSPEQRERPDPQTEQGSSDQELPSQAFRF